MFAPKRILHPTDFSECSALAFQMAVDLALQNQASLIVLHAVETLGADNVLSTPRRNSTSSRRPIASELIDESPSRSCRRRILRSRWSM